MTRAADVLGGEWRDVAGQRFLVVDRTLRPRAIATAAWRWPTRCPRATGSGRAGTVDGRDALRLNPCGSGAADAPSSSISKPPAWPAAPGTYAFLVGCAWFEGGSFRIRQFFLSRLRRRARRCSMPLPGVAGAGTVVTYNGKSFDLPLIETRFVLHRRETPFAGLPHVDMLHPARRLWRERRRRAAGSRRSSRRCAATSARVTCPASRSRPATSTTSAAATRGRSRRCSSTTASTCCRWPASRRAPPSCSTTGPRGRVAPARRSGWAGSTNGGGLLHEARACFMRACELDDGDAGDGVEALRAYAIVSRRLRCHEDAAAAWRRILELPSCSGGDRARGRRSAGRAPRASRARPAGRARADAAIADLSGNDGAAAVAAASPGPAGAENRRRRPSRPSRCSRGAATSLGQPRSEGRLPGGPPRLLRRRGRGRRRRRCRRRACRPWRPLAAALAATVGAAPLGRTGRP